MSVDDRNRIGICDRDMVWLNTDDRAKTFMGVVDGFVTTSSSALIHQPQIGEGSRKGGGDIPQPPFLEIRDDIVEQGQSEKEVGCIQEGNKHHWSFISRM